MARIRLANGDIYNVDESVQDIFALMAAAAPSSWIELTSNGVTIRVNSFVIGIIENA